MDRAELFLHGTTIGVEQPQTSIFNGSTRMAFLSGQTMESPSMLKASSKLSLIFSLTGLEVPLLVGLTAGAEVPSLIFNALVVKDCHSGPREVLLWRQLWRLQRTGRETRLSSGAQLGTSMLRKSAYREFSNGNREGL